MDYCDSWKQIILPRLCDMLKMGCGTGAASHTISIAWSAGYGCFLFFPLLKKDLQLQKKNSASLSMPNKGTLHFLFYFRFSAFFIFKLTVFQCAVESINIGVILAFMSQ